MIVPTRNRADRLRLLLDSISAAQRDLAGLLDDDERIDAAWLSTVFEAFQDSDVGYGRAAALAPEGISGVIGWVEAGPDVVEYGPEKPA